MGTRLCPCRSLRRDAIAVTSSRKPLMSRGGFRFGEEQPLVPKRLSSFSVWPRPKQRKHIFSRAIAPLGSAAIADSSAAYSSDGE